MSQWQAGLEATAEEQRIVVSTCGTQFKVNGYEVYPKGNQARTLAALCKFGGVGEDNCATYKQLISFIWSASTKSSFNTLKANLLANIYNLRDAGLREAIRNHRGVGFYWSPKVSIGFKDGTAIIPPTTTDRNLEVIEEKIEKARRDLYRGLSETLNGVLPKEVNDLAPKLMKLGFRKADLARMFGVTRPTIQNWLRKFK